MLAVENVSIDPEPAVADELALDETVPPPERSVLPLMVVVEETCPFPAVTDDEVDAALPASIVSATVQVVPSAKVTVSAVMTGSAIKTAGMQAMTNSAFDTYPAEVIVSLRSLSSNVDCRERPTGRSHGHFQHLRPSFLARPGGQSFLPCAFSAPSGCALPAAEPPVPTELVDIPSVVDVPPVPTVEAEPDPSPDPTAEPPVPTELFASPPPADVPPVPSVEAEPEPDPEADPAVPTELLDVPPPAEVPPVASVDADPVSHSVPRGQSTLPAELPPVPTVLVEVPPPADVPPVPTVLLVCA